MICDFFPSWEILVKYCTEHANHIAMLCQPLCNISEGSSTKICVVGEWGFAKFEETTSLLSYAEIQRVTQAHEISNLITKTVAWVSQKLFTWHHVNWVKQLNLPFLVQSYSIFSKKNSRKFCDFSTTSERSTIVLLTQAHLIVEVWQYCYIAWSHQCVPLSILDSVTFSWCCTWAIMHEIIPNWCASTRNKASSHLVSKNHDLCDTINCDNYFVTFLLIFIYS